jgi:hypothetical protein
MIARPPFTLSRLIAKAAAVAISNVITPVATAITSEFQNCCQKWCK